MLKVLVNAYACSPGMGSEPGMAWNWVVNLAKYCELYIITEGEFRGKIETAVADLPQGGNLHFHYNPVSAAVRQMCWNQGDWRFYKHYKDWQWKTYLLAKDICANEHIDVLHQLNMIGFREPGYLWKLSEETGIKFVWGPVGGLKQFPIAYLGGAGIRMNLLMRLKNMINVWQLKHNKRVDKALKNASVLISSIPDSYFAIKKYKGFESIVIPETGCFPVPQISTDRFDAKEFHILWVGKFDFRKQLHIALRAIAATRNKNIILDVYGTGSTEQIQRAMALSDELNVDNQIVWHGSRPNDEVIYAMKKAQLFFFTSVNEDTSTVVLEAVSNQLPVVCFEACGMAAVIDNSVGRKIPLSNPKQSVRDFAQVIDELEHNRECLKDMSKNCIVRQQQLSWDIKAQKMVDYYNKS